MKKVDARKQTREKIHKRRKQVIQLHTEGTPVMQIVKKCGLSWQAVNKAIKLNKEGDESVLKPAARGRKQGTGRILSEEQETKIRKLISRRPWQTGTDGYRFLWNRNLVIRLIEKKCGIKLSVRVMGNYLKRWGFVLKKPNKRSYERCSPTVRKWLDENYPKIMQRALDEDAEIHWANKTRVIHTGMRDHSNVPNGQTYEDGKRWMISVTSNQGKLRWQVIRGAFTQDRQIKFLNALAKDSRKKVFLIREDLKYFYKYDVFNWIRQNEKKIELFPKPEIPSITDSDGYDSQRDRHYKGRYVWEPEYDSDYYDYY